MKRAVALAAALTALALAPASGSEAARACEQDLGLDPAVCAIVAETESGVTRTGLSFADYSAAPAARVDAQDFAFGPRVSLIRDGQTVTFRNINRAGGNPHSVTSSDFGTTAPVLPVPVVAFGGGHGFRSGRLTPGEPFFLHVDIATMDPAAYAVLPNGDVAIGFHCYIHGASQMSGVLVVRTS